MPKTKTALRRLLLAACCCLALPMAAHADLDKIRASGTLTVAVYKNFVPFSDGAADHMTGIDVALARALAEQMGLKLALLPFDAGENMSDDLRNMVWKGHYLGYGPADVMLHVPVDRNFMQQNKQARIFGPYYRETVVLAHDRKRLPQVIGAEDLKGSPLAAERGTAAASALAGALSGALRDQVHMTDTPQAAMESLRHGDVAAVMATRAEVEAALPMAERDNYGLAELQLGGIPSKGWAVGMAVKADDQPLADALDAALVKLRADGRLKQLFEQSGVTLVAP